MTREEAIKNLQEIIEEGWLISDFDKCTAIDACEMAIKALEQEPCEDAITRILKRMWNCRGKHTTSIDKTKMERIIRDEFPSVTPQQKLGHSFPEGATNKDIFKAIFGYEPATDSVVCNKEDWCGASEPCNYCINNSNNIGREEDWWNAPYKAESEE